MTVQIADIIVPENFTNYIQQQTEEKSRLITSGAMVVDPFLNEFLAGAGLTINVPSYQDLANNDDNISTDSIADIIALSTSGGTPALPASFNDAVPDGVSTSQEIAVRKSRNKSWSSMDLASALAGNDPLAAIESRVLNYWLRRLQAIFVATVNGVVADNEANDSGDYVNDISGASFVAGVTNFTAEALIDTSLTMGDSMDNLSMIMVHSVVYARMKKNNLIDFIPDSMGVVNIPTFQGHAVVVDDGLPVTGQVYDSWMFGPGFMRFGQGDPKVATETSRQAAAGNGGGQETLHSRREYCLHPGGHAYTGTSPNGGPANTSAANQLANAGSWDRVYPERKQISFACLRSREA